jgi:hypothetical protein
MSPAFEARWDRRRTARTAIGLVLVGVALYAAGSLGASIGSDKRAAAVEYQYPGITMDAAPNPTTVGHPVTVTWSTTNVDSCTAFGEWSGTKTLAGSEVDLAWGWQNSFFALDCTGIWGETEDGVFVDVTQPLTSRATADQQQTYVDDFVQHAGMAQTFTVGSGGWLSDVRISGTGTKIGDRVAITRVTGDGAPDPAHVLWTTTVASQATVGTLHLAKPLLVFPGQRLALTLSAPGPVDEDYVYGPVACDSPHPYTRGDLYVQDDPGGSWARQEGCDLDFTTFVVQRFRTGP